MTVKAIHAYDAVRSDESNAVFSSCGLYRYALIRNWTSPLLDEEVKRVAFIGLNPSTADATKNDPTVRRCIQFAKDWGYTGIVMLNAFAYRATDPHVMKMAVDPTGGQNDSVLAHVCDQMDCVVACWGTHCGHRRRDAELSLLLPQHAPIDCLGFTQGGLPKHPLYLKSSTVPVPFWPFTGKRTLPEAPS